MYTVETLKEYNNNNPNLAIRSTTVEKINAVVSIIENRDSNTPQVGDIVQIKTKNGREYKNARIDHIEEKTASVCTQPYVPYTSTGISASISGGYFKNALLKDLKKIGEEKREFWNFANGSGANMGIYFKAKVSIWQFTGDSDTFY